MKCVECGGEKEMYWLGGPLCFDCYERLRSGFLREISIKTGGGFGVGVFKVVRLPEEYLFNDRFMMIVAAAIDKESKKGVNVCVGREIGDEVILEEVLFYDFRVWRVLDEMVIRVRISGIEYNFRVVPGSYLIVAR